MLDRLVESESHTAENKRRNSFLVSTLFLVTMMFGGAMLYSLFAKPLGMMDGDLELSSIVAPVPPAENEPPTEIPKRETNKSNVKTNDTPQRIVLQQTIDESPKIPDSISTVKNQYASRPRGEVRIGKADTDFGNSGAVRSSEGSDNNDGIRPTAPKVSNDDEEKDPPKMTPKVETPQPKNVIKSLGVANGIAKDLPKPIYPTPAKAVKAQGAVNVQIIIDEQGRVISANAVSGHPLLRQAAEQAARRAVFSPTKLSNVPVKASGIIVYNFVAQQ